MGDMGEPNPTTIHWPSVFGAWNRNSIFGLQSFQSKENNRYKRPISLTRLIPHFVAARHRKKK